MELKKLNKIEEFNATLKKLCLDGQGLEYKEKSYILSCAVIFFKYLENIDINLAVYQEAFDLAYYIVLKYSLTFNDFQPLYDIAVDIGLFPIANAISELGLVSQNIKSSLIELEIEREFRHKNIIETLEQRVIREKIVGKESANRVYENENLIVNTGARRELPVLSKEISYIAPTSFGKSNIIIEHIQNNITKYNTFAIIVPTKSLLTQTYRSVKKAGINSKIIIHDEMYNQEEKFIAILTQERALRLLEENNIFFDYLYIDEAHNLFECGERSILLSRLLRLNRKRSQSAKVIYLSPLINKSKNLSIDNQQEILEQKIHLNIKSPEYFEYKLDNLMYRYNKFTGDFYQLCKYNDIFEYIYENGGQKNFCYLRAPKKIERFAGELAAKLPEFQNVKSLQEVIKNLQEHVHKDFFAVDYVKKGIIYLHGKLPDNVKEYLESKFSTIPQLLYLVANTVVLEGVNMPIDKLFILSVLRLSKVSLINLIGRVNRLDKIFGETPDLSKLIPQIHFVNSNEYNRARSNMANKMALLKNNLLQDEVENPVLLHTSAPDETIKKREEEYLIDTTNESELFKKKLLSLGVNTLMNIEIIYAQLYEKIKNYDRDDGLHVMQLIHDIFIKDYAGFIMDDEFRRLANQKAINYYVYYFESRRTKSLKENITAEIHYYHERMAVGDAKMYIGDSFGEIQYIQGRGRNVYIDLFGKTDKQLVNLAIIKIKMEEDFISHKLGKFINLLREYEIISKSEYNRLIYGSNDDKKLHLLKTGLTINIINKLENDGQLNNISIDANNNLSCNDAFLEYKEEVDDFFRFQIEKYIV